MTKYISILRGINVGGHRKILMKDLKELYSSLGLKNVSSYIQSGNLVFESSKSHTELEATIHKAIEKKYGFDVPIIVRNKEEIEEAIQNNPYIEEDLSNITQVAMTFMKSTPSSENIEALKGAIETKDEYQIIGKNIYILLQRKYHETKLSNNFFEKKLGVECTTRNWKTVLNLKSMLE